MNMIEATIKEYLEPLKQGADIDIKKLDNMETPEAPPQLPGQFPKSDLERIADILEDIDKRLLKLTNAVNRLSK